MGDNDSIGRSLPQSDIERILRRAIEIDGESRDGEAEAAVREIARELGVSDSAVGRALAEHRPPYRQGLGTSAVQRVTSFASERAVLVGGGAFALGALARALRPLFVHGPHWESIVSVGLLTGVAAIAAFWPRRRDAQWGFQSFNLTLWAGYTAGWSLINGGIWGDLLGVSAASAAGCAVIGGAISMFRNRRPRTGSPSSTPQRAAAPKTFLDSLRRRLRLGPGRTSGPSSLPGDLRAGHLT